MSTEISGARYSVGRVVLYTGQISVADRLAGHQVRSDLSAELVELSK